MTNLALAAEFPATDAAEWRKLVDTALKGASFDKRLVSQTYDGLRVEPLYPRAANAAPIAGRAAEPWQVLQRVDHPDPAAANTEALQDLENGASGLVLVFAGAPSATRFRPGRTTADALDRALAGVMLDLIPLRVETAPFAGRPVATLIGALVERTANSTRRRWRSTSVSIRSATWRAPASAILPWPELSARAGATAKDLKAKGFAKARFLRADGRAVHEAGGSEAQELAFVVATGVAYLRLLEAAGFTLDEARNRISFLLAADADEFLTIAKFRAFRKLWARVEQASGLTPEPAFVVGGDRMADDDARDPNVNMLRTTIAIAAAGLGGADSDHRLAASPARSACPTAFARRVARNSNWCCWRNRISIASPIRLPAPAASRH